MFLSANLAAHAMSSPSNAIGPSSAAAASVQWQIDIPSLSQLIVSLGASGLKQLASAGVDVHSMGSLLLIANLTPTTIEYRRELNRIRESQRSERIWLYKFVEIGAATNFLVDQLLKTRAGENVLALFSALLPLLLEKDFATVLLKSFENFDIPADSTPGLGQIARIRTALSPFTARTDIKDRIVQYHSLFSRLVSTKSSLSDAIPPIQVIPEILGILHKLITHDAPFHLDYHGILGAAWVAAYGCQVLGLRACAILSNGDVMSLNATYDDAQILFYIDSPKLELSLRQRSNIEDFIVISGLNRLNTAEAPWLINCDNINYLEYHYPNVQTGGLWEEISNDVVNEAFLALSHVIDSGFKQAPSQELLNYAEYYLSEIQDRLLIILTILGFNPQAKQFYTQKLKHSPRTRDCVEPRKFSGNPSVSRALRQAVNISVVLAFTNWHMTIRSISAMFFEPVQLNILSMVYSFELDFDGRSFEGLLLNTIVEYCTATNKRAFYREDSGSRSPFLARDVDGTVLLRNSIYEQSLHNLKGFIWTLYPGKILGGYDNYRYLREEPGIHENIALAQSGPYRLELAPDVIQPQNILPQIAVRHNISMAVDTIWTSAHVFVNESTILSMSILRICYNTTNMFISKSCPHPIDTALEAHKILDDDIWIEGLFFDTLEMNKQIQEKGRSAKRLFILQQVGENILGQWISCGAYDFHASEVVLIWQRCCCLSCIIQNLLFPEQRLQLLPRSGPVVYVIIADTVSRTPNPREE